MIIIHRDIEPPNILLNMPYVHNSALWSASADADTSLTPEERQAAQDFLQWTKDRELRYHLTDFELGKFSTGALLSRVTNAIHWAVGTPGYIAPEAMRDTPTFSARPDVYSLGCLLFSLCTCKQLPSLEVTGGKMSDVSDHYPKRLALINKRCLESDPSLRPNGREVLKELTD